MIWMCGCIRWWWGCGGWRRCQCEIHGEELGGVEEFVEFIAIAVVMIAGCVEERGGWVGYGHGGFICSVDDECGVVCK